LTLTWVTVSGLDMITLAVGVTLMLTNPAKGTLIAVTVNVVPGFFVSVRVSPVKMLADWAVVTMKNVPSAGVPETANCQPFTDDPAVSARAVPAAATSYGNSGTQFSAISHAKSPSCSLTPQYRSEIWSGGSHAPGGFTSARNDPMSAS